MKTNLYNKVIDLHFFDIKLKHRIKSRRRRSLIKQESKNIINDYNLEIAENIEEQAIYWGLNKYNFLVKKTFFVIK